MAWKVSFKKEIFKFLSKQVADTQDRIRASLNSLLNYLDRGIFPFNEMDIKKLRGQRKDFLRLRTGSIRILFKVDTSNKEIRVYAIDYRGDVYKG